jgi:hypothetical protein
MGKVLDAGTGETIPFANIYFKGTTIGVTSNFDGDFSIETGRASDTLVASFIGYHKSELPIRQNRFNQVTFSLERESMELSEVVIRPGENPAEILLRKIIENKSLNNRDEYAHYRYEAYSNHFASSSIMSIPLPSMPKPIYLYFCPKPYRISTTAAHPNPPKRSSAPARLPESATSLSPSSWVISHRISMSTITT